MTEITKRLEQKIKLDRSSFDHPKRRKRPTNISPVTSSTMGYSKEIGALQLLHLPLRRIKLTRGILQNQGMRDLHLGQAERPHRIDSLWGRRTIHTLKKLPHNKPKTKTRPIAIASGKVLKRGLTSECLSVQKLKRQQSEKGSCKPERK